MNVTPYLKEVQELRVEGNAGQDHILINGDNIHSLNIMQATHKNKVDVICIDPPYNTGNEFIYDDNRKNEWYLWMEERIKLSINLMKEDGIFYVFIGHDELANLIIMCDQLFGKKNRITIFSRVTDSKGGQGSLIKQGCDYILMYSKNKSLLSNIGEKREEGHVDVQGLIFEPTDSKPTQRYWIECPDGSFVIPKGLTKPKEVKEGLCVRSEIGENAWKWGLETYTKEKELGNVLITPRNTPNEKVISSDGSPVYWDFKKQKILTNAKIIPNFISKWHTATGTKELKEIFDGKKVFDFPKATGLIKYLIEITNKPKDITVLDFFAGSGTTGHAVIDLNSTDNGTRKSIMCAIDEEGANICQDVTYERLKRVTDKCIKEKNRTLDLLGDGFPPTLKYFEVKIVENNDPLTQLRAEENNKKLLLNEE